MCELASQMGHDLKQNPAREKEQIACGSHSRRTMFWVPFLFVFLAVPGLQLRNSFLARMDVGGRWRTSLTVISISVFHISSSAMAATSPVALPVLEVHTPQSSFAVVHSRRACSSPSRPKLTPQNKTYIVQGDTLQSLFAKLRRKAGEESIGYVVGAGWVKYEWNGAFWDLDDGSLVTRRLSASTLQSFLD